MSQDLNKIETKLAEHSYKVAVVRAYLKSQLPAAETEELYKKFKGVKMEWSLLKLL